MQGQGNTLSVSTGPPTDHTTGLANGTYMFIEASSPRRPNEKARFISQSFTAVPVKGKCLIFWYHMFGADIGTLNVLQKTGPGNKSEKIIWNLSGQQGSQWLEGRVALSKIPSSSYWIVFEGIRGNGYRGDIAIDDILIKDGNCPTQPANAGRDKIPTTPQVTTPFTLPPPIPPSLYNCDFEKGMCNYTQEHITDVFNWTRHQGGTYSSGTGPTMDHTKQQGVVGPNGPGSLQHMLSAKCLHIYLGGWSKPKEGTTIVLYDGCGENRLEFQLTSDGYLKWTKFNMCVSQRKGSGANANDIVLMNSCTEKWTFTASGSLKHGPTGRCVMPNKGSATNNNKIVLSSTCDTDNQKFRWQPSKLHKVFSFVFLILLSLLVNRCYNMANKLVQVLGVGFLFKQNIRSFSMS